MGGKTTKRVTQGSGAARRAALPASRSHPAVWERALVLLYFKEG